MGWLWSSSSSAVTAQDNALGIPKPNPESSATSQPTTTSSQPLSRDEIAEKELESFLQELSADTRPSTTKYNRIPKQPSHPTTAVTSDEPLSEQLLPTTMSCRNAFDSAFYCNSLGGQFNHLYRYGTVGSCSEKWNDFWFCMRTRSYGAQQKGELIKERYREKERIKYGKDEVGKSSEDVWKSRESKLEWGEAFSKPDEGFEGDDEAWNKLEMQRRSEMGNGTMGS